MRICIFAHPGATHTKRMVAALRERGATVHLVYKGDHNPEGATYERFGVPGLSLGNSVRRSVRRARYLSKFFKEHDLVTVFYLSDWGFYDEAIEHGRLALWPWGSDINAPPGAPPETPRLRERRMAMFEGAQGIATCSHWFAEQVADYAGINASRINVIPLGVDMDLFKPASQPVREPIVGFLKGFGPAYGAERFIDAMPEIVARVPDVRFELVGTSDRAKVLQRCIVDLDIASRITWIEPKPHDEIPSLLQRWQVSVIPSVVESFGVAALESSACGVPVVASNVGGLPETVIHDKTGMLTDASDPEQLAESVIGLLTDEDRRIDMGRSGQRFVASHFQWDACVDRWMRFFEFSANGTFASETGVGHESGRSLVRFASANWRAVGS
ncbi:MAG: glycosyltransferase family 4 protein [Phycisphaerales bacterium]|nr:glycosyltransferase family 4 protein [Phycisphaerales bacterium]